MAAVKVSIDELDSWLQAQPENTPETAYRLNIYGVGTHNESDIATILKNNSNKYVDLRKTLLLNNGGNKPDITELFLNCTTLVGAPIINIGVQVMDRTFKGCTNLRYTPFIPESVVSIEGVFENCTSLSEGPILSSKINNAISAFSGCESLESISFEDISYEDIDSDYIFSGCLNLKKISTENIQEAKDWLNQLYEAHFIEILPDSLIYSQITPYEVYIDSLENWLCSRHYNLEKGEQPYIIKLKGITTENYTELKSIISKRCSKYNTEQRIIDLSPTTLPVGITDLSNFFANSLLTGFPSIPEGVINIDYIFDGCNLVSDIRKFPQLPDSILSMQFAFRQCNITKPPKLPPNVLNLRCTFQECKDLEETPNIPISVQNTQATFGGCRRQNQRGLHIIYMEKCINPSIYINMFLGCDYVSDIFTKEPEKVKEWLKKIQNETYANFPSELAEIKFHSSEFINIDELEDFLSKKEENSLTSPYKIEITDLTVESCKSLGEIIQRCGRYVDLSDTILPEGLTSLMIDETEDGIFEDCEYLVEPPVLPSTLTSTERGFSGCTSLKTAPIIPEGVTEMRDTFRGCTSLEEAPVIPDTVTALERAFENCSSLTEPPIIPDSAINLTETFSGCTSLTYKVAANYLHSNTYEGVSTTHWKGRADQLQYLFAEDEDVTEYEILETGQVLHFENGALVIPISELDSALQSLSENTAGSAYKIKVTELTTENIGDIKTALRNNPAKYVNLSLTVLPEVTSLNECFSQCSTLVESPVLPNGLEEMVRMFLDCENLKRFPLIPTTVTNMDDAFYGCSSVDGEIILPPNLTEMWSTFQGCSSLSITPVIPENVIKMNGTFCGCASLPEFPDIPDGVIQLVDTFEGCVLVKDPPVLPNNNIIFESTFLNCTSLKTPPVIPDSTEYMIRMFGGCSSLEEVPEIPSTVTSMRKAFEGCTSISETSIIPSSVVEFGKAFSGCTALTTAKLSKLNYEVLEEELSEQKLIFEGCSNLQTVYTDEPYELKSFFSHLSEEYEGSTPDPDTLTYKLLSSPAEIPLTNLSNDLATLEENTLETPFNIKITDININNLSEFKTALTANPTKFVDLHETILPQNVSEFNGTFEDCTTLIKAPAIPESVTDIGGMFANCSNLEELPEIPNGVEIMSGAFTGCSKIEEIGAIPPSVTNMYAAFMDCTSLKTVSIIPESVTVFSQAFNGCSALERIDEFNLPMSVLQSSASGCFNGCTSLTSIIIPTSEVITNDNWHIVMLEFGPTTVKGKVFDYDPETKQTTVHVIPETTVEKNKMTLLQITDELWFPETETAEDIEDLIERIIENRYGYYNKTVIPPDKKSFVLYAADKNSVISNLDLGGGGEGQGLAFIGTEAEFKEALRIPFGEQGYIFPNSLSLISDKNNYLMGEIHNE